MRTFACRRYISSLSIAGALLTGCGGSRPPTGAPGAMPQSRALAARGDSSNYKVLYRFLGPPDGDHPYASLIDVHGALYGTTNRGGTAKRGVIFSVTKRGTENVLYSVKRRPDGADPEAALIDVKGTLYGTTVAGGKYYYSYYSDSGTVFSITTSGSEKVLHSFGYGTDGVHPAASLIDAKGVLYGTTLAGGKYDHGTVFKITTSGSEKVVYSFAGGIDGIGPAAGLIDVGGTFYGTTSNGGAYTECTGGNGCGTVFSITRSGSETVLHSFGYGTDGSHPRAGLIDVDGTLYGTTSSGGTHGNGTVFSITTTGSENVVYSFAGGNDGAQPVAGLINMGGTLYGTTLGGGGSGCDFYDGCGTVYSVSTSGAEALVHVFTGGSDGANPRAALLDVAGVLYGTTANGGLPHKGKCPTSVGCGTVFALSL